MIERAPQDQDKYVVRFPDGMRGRLKDAAERHTRSLNAEIVARLASTFEGTMSDERATELLSAIRSVVMAQRISDLFSPDVVEAIGGYLVSDAKDGDSWDAVVEELVVRGLASAGHWTDDAPSTHVAAQPSKPPRGRKGKP